MTAVDGTNQLALNNPAVNWGFISNPVTNSWSLGYGPSVTTLGTQVLTWNTNGYVGVGTTNPSDLFQVNSGSIIRFQVGASTGVWVNNEVNGGTPAAPGDLYLSYRTGGNTLINTNGGNVAIGTLDAKGYKLAVNGSAIATSVTVKLNSAWPDYVFNEQYLLPGLRQVESYINQNHRLPEMPSGKEIMEKGLDLGEMNKMLTQKVEELTLYLIKADKDNQEQKIKLEQQDARIAALEAKLTANH